MKATLNLSYASLLVAYSLGVGFANAQEAKPVEPTQATDAAVATKPVEPDERTQQVLALMKAKNYDCLNCHRVDTKLVGPSYKEVAAKRKNDKWAPEKLAGIIKRGGTGEYGEGPAMPPHSGIVSDADIKTIVDWILSL